ncbi:MAG: FkbM family methyltransferase, partial [Flavobacterium sp.]
ANIFAVEMEPNNYLQLKKNILQFKNAQPIFGAIYDEEKNFTISNTELAYNFKIGTIEDEFDAFTVATLTMHDLIASHHIVEIDLLKIGIEGAEERILRNNNEWLKVVKSILIEIHEPYGFEDLKKDLGPFNFKLFPIGYEGLNMIYAVREWQSNGFRSN